jgi:ubiquinone/menaquinone biosynthesis C-methylase UbiE
MSSNHHELWESDAEARLLETRLNGFWNPDYFTRILLPLLNLQPGSKVLDVGAGNGALTLLLARYLPNVLFIGLDLTASLVEEAKQQAQKMNLQNVEFMEGDALQLPFESESFDATVCQTLLIHLGQPAKAVAEMSRILKSGGSFMAAEFHLLFPEMPIESEEHSYTVEEEMALSRYMHMILHGYRNSGQGDLKIGGRIPFLARKAGLAVVDVRINDRVPHAFPPYGSLANQASLAELQSWEVLSKDAGYRAWLTSAITAGGGTESDVDGFLKFFPSHPPEAFHEHSNFAFVWLINPILLVTVARKGSTE